MNTVKIKIAQSIGIAIVALVYLISPIDIIPDAFLGLGQMDDIAVISLAAVNAYRAYTLHKQNKKQTKNDEKPKADAIDVEYKVLDDE